MSSPADIRLHDTATGLHRVVAILGELHHCIAGTTDRERVVACALHEAAEREVAHLLAEAVR